jgi:surface antigen
MRFRARAEVLLLSLAVAVPTATLSLFPAHAEEAQTPLAQSTPRLDITWSEARQPKGASFNKLRSNLDAGDAYATLNALHVALSSVGDGQTYVWGRPKRQLRALITPTKSYRNADKRICRNVVVTLSLGSHIERTETAACRAEDKSWQFAS